MKSANLFFKEGSSDKEYHASVEASGKGYVVNFSFGRRGTALQAGTKTQAPVGLDEANKIFDALVTSKLAKGYKANGTSVIPVTPVTTKESSGLVPQLLNPIDEGAVDSYLKNDAYMAQEKYDGKHKLVRKTGQVIEFINRKGQIVSGSTNIEHEFQRIQHDFVLDGEDLGESIAAFDLLELNGEDLRSTGALQRLQRLGSLNSFNVARTETSTEGKTKLYRSLRENNKEGIVFKLKSAPYVPGRPSSGGSMVKFKFWASASCRVLKVNAKRSVEVGLFDEEAEKWVSVGNVTIGGKIEIPKVSDVIEVKYLYAYKGGSLYQPSFISIRDDVLVSNCLISQLKYKSEE